MDYEKLLKTYRKRAIVTDIELDGKSSFSAVSYGREDIKKLIPHRDPFLLVDRIAGIDIAEGEETIIAVRHISADDPVFKGHFPGFPVYPGALQVEMGGQAGLCLTYFALNKTHSIAPDAKPVNVRATKVLGALFLEPLFPGKDAKIIAKTLEYDGYFGTVLTQIISDDKICTVGIAEVIFLDE
jgi:3-hydroxyacyl-[acyl-carrier-protein] dehydratase